jgi:hypothetical protein
VGANESHPPSAADVDQEESGAHAAAHGRVGGGDQGDAGAGR